MSSTRDPNEFAAELLLQGQPLDDSAYKEYRMKLENALASAERREKLTERIAVIAFVAAFILMFVGGTRVFGSFDPFEKEATIVSMMLGVVYVIANVVWPISLAVYFSRFRPRVREIKDQIRDTNILALQCEIDALRKQIAAMSPPAGH
ncbi:MAG: hypothetical protein ACT4QC_22250 [Planctomycetaceae bacterium]